MAKGRLKITQMTPKGANLDPTDLLEISEDTGSGYVTRSITGQEIIDAASGGTQDLQSVTDNGATTDNAITITGAGDNQVYIDGNYVIAEDTVTNTSAALDSNGALLLNNAGNEESSLKNSNVSNPGVILEFPNKATGSYTIATTVDIPTGLPPTGSAGGDLSGTYPNPNVSKIHGIDMQSGTPTSGDTWVYGGSPAKWQHQMLHASQVDNDSAVTGTHVDAALNTLNTNKVNTSRTISINGTTQDLSADRTYTVTDANLSTSDVTTNDVSTTKHGFVPKAPNDTTKFLRGDATWAAPFMYKKFVNSSAVTGTTAETLAVTLTINANELSSSDILKFFCYVNKTGTSGTTTIKLKYNSTNNFATATEIAKTTASAATNRYVPLIRNSFAIFGGNLYGFSFSSFSYDDSSVGAVPSSVAFDVTQANYFFISITLGNATDSAIITTAQLSNI